MTITPHRTSGTSTAAVPAPLPRPAPGAGVAGRRGRPRPSRAGALAVEVSSLVGRVRSATSSPSGRHLSAGLVVTALGGAAAALLLGPA